MLRFSLLATLALFASSSWGQGTVTIFGTVSDGTGAVIANASILVTNTENGSERRTVTDATGKYFVTQLPIGIYSVRAEAAGFKAWVETKIPTQVNENRRVDVAMELGAVSESVSVTGQLAQVETREGVLKEVVDSLRIVELPLNGRNPLQLQYLVAGIGGRSAGGGGQA